MPDLNTTLHLEMYQQYRKRNSFFHRLRRAVRELGNTTQLYGLEWGDPEVFGPLKFVRDRYVLPYVDSQRTALDALPSRLSPALCRRLPSRVAAGIEEEFQSIQHAIHP